MTKEVLIKLANAGYTALVRKHGDEYYMPTKGAIDLIIESLSIAPMHEDDFVDIRQAINIYDLEKAEFESIKVKHLSVL